MTAPHTIIPNKLTLLNINYNNNKVMIKCVTFCHNVRCMVIMRPAIKFDSTVFVSRLFTMRYRLSVVF